MYCYYQSMYGISPAPASTIITTRGLYALSLRSHSIIAGVSGRVNRLV